MATFISGFETFGIEAGTLSEELSKMCASATSGQSAFMMSPWEAGFHNAAIVSPLPGKGADQEVMVQGEHRKIVSDMLVAKGVPENCVHTTGIKGGKGKKT